MHSYANMYLQKAKSFVNRKYVTYNTDEGKKDEGLTCSVTVLLNMLATESEKGLHTDVETGFAILE